MAQHQNADSLRLKTHLGNWRQAPFNRWAFHNVRQVVPTAPIRPARVPSALPFRSRSLSGLDCTDRTGRSRGFDRVLEDSHTDAIIVLREGEILEERYFNGMRPHDPHILMSVSKSITAAVAGVLSDREILDPGLTVERYIGELAGTGFEGATVQQVLDMRTGIAFDEDYQATEGPMIAYRESTGWNPISGNAFRGGLHDFLLGLKADRAHGGAFQYTSPNTDLLGWIIERASGQSMASLIEEILWAPLGAEFEANITLDRLGASRTAGGISATLRDLARLGLAMLAHGTADGRSVLPAWWVRETTVGGDEQAWADGNFAHLLPGGRYRNKWYQYGNELRAFCAIGIHGQFLYVAPEASVVIAHFGSQPEPFNADVEVVLLDAFDAIARACG